MLALLLATHFYYPANAPLYRYDFLTLAAISIQLLLIGFRLESWQEAKIILIFHLVGTVMELFKTSAGSWIYPEPSILKIGQVPLFSGFMYASVGSYIARVSRIFDFRFSNYPSPAMTYLLGIAIYVNFFAHHWLPDIRILLFLGIFFFFRKTWIFFHIWKTHRRMPLLLGWFLVALFIWFAENLGTFSRAWIYPAQSGGWHMVSPGKLGAWYLLMYISFILVMLIRPVKPPDHNI